MRCIYCLEQNNAFTKREHIILRTIGGVNSLPLGMVCDECNESFSKYERRFVYDSIISIPKQFEGPRGRHGLYKSRLHPMESLNDGSVSIGYIEEGGKPRVVPQFIVKHGGTICFAGNNDSQNIFAVLLNKIKETPNSAFIKKTFDDIEDDRIHISYFDDKLFLFKNKKMTDNQETDLLNLIQKGTIDVKGCSMDRRKSQIKAHQSFSFNIDDMGRIICKMVFNLIAKYYPSEIFETKFDSLRRYIRYNESINENKFFQRDENASNFLRGLRQKFGITDKTHSILLYNVPQRPNILGFISLYDHFGFFVNSGFNHKIIRFNRPRLYINEYKNRKEYEYTEELIKMINQEGTGA